MGFRLVRIGNKVNVGEVKRFTFRRSLRGSAVIIFILVLFALVSAPKLLGYETPRWYSVTVSTLIVLIIGAIDKQLPTRRWKNLTICLLLMGACFASFLIRGFISGKLPTGTDEWIVGGLLVIALGYGFYGLWRWRRNILRYKDLVVQRKLRARRRRKIVY